MTYRVIVQPRAYRDLADQYEYIAQRSPETADRWFNRFLAAIEGLAALPERCPVAGESAVVGRELRQLLFGKGYGVRRVIFFIEDDTVQVVSIRHSARGEATADELLGD